MNDKSYNVIMSSMAADVLISHARFIANVSGKAATQFIEEFYNKTKSLEKFPERNSLVVDSLIPEGKYRKLTILKRYLIIYQIKNDSVYVDAILDCRQDYKWLL